MRNLKQLEKARDKRKQSSLQLNQILKVNKLYVKTMKDNR